MAAMVISVEQLVEQLTSLNLVAAAEIEAAIESAPEPIGPGDGEALADLLVERKKLSLYQADKICDGQGDSLVLGNYVIHDVLGQGGMGMVLKAVHRRMERVVALKVLSAGFVKNPEAVQRFHREVKAAARLEHPNIVTAHDADEANGVHFLVMQYVEGSDLAARVKQFGPLPVGEALSYVLQAARGLHYAHERGVVHRDIKPANLLLDRQGKVQILDMGLARIDGENSNGAAELTHTGAVFGTVDYMAPEQGLSAKHADARSDIYSLGITLWYLLTGRPAYEGDSLMSKLLAHRDQPIPSLRDVRPDVTLRLEAVFKKMAAKAPNARYQRMSEVIAEIEECTLEAGNAPSEIGKSEPKLAGVDHGSDLGAETTPYLGNEVTVSARKSDFARAKRPALYLWPFIGGAVCLLLICTATLGVLLLGDGEKETSLDQTAPKTISTRPKAAIVPFSSEDAKNFQTAWAAHLRLPVEHVNSLGMKFRLIPPGEFRMGSEPSEIAEAVEGVRESKLTVEMFESEAPAHHVTLTKAFYLSVYEVTQSEYEEVMGHNPSRHCALGEGRELVAGMSTARFPVESIPWSAAAEFCAKLSQLEKLGPNYERRDNKVKSLEGTGYYLPTEAEWEFACRAGTITRFWAGNEERDLARVGWYNRNSGVRTHEVGELPANPFGLYDIHGNVTEWVRDAWTADSYQKLSESKATDPCIPIDNDSGQPRRGSRGGVAGDDLMLCRSSARCGDHPDSRGGMQGMRIALSIEAVRGGK
jgi:serine/threonine protein kinase